jgi:hypothetical protein
MDNNLDTYLTTPPSLRYAFGVRVVVGPIRDLGQTARGHRRIIDIQGGEVAGPMLEGEILPGGADWQIVRPDGTIEVVARYTIRARSGALVYVQNDGLRVASSEILARMSRGELVPFDSYHFRTAPASRPPIRRSRRWSGRPSSASPPARRTGSRSASTRYSNIVGEGVCQVRNRTKT